MKSFLRRGRRPSLPLITCGQYHDSVALYNIKVGQCWNLYYNKNCYFDFHSLIIHTMLDNTDLEHKRRS